MIWTGIAGSGADRGGGQGSHGRTPLPTEGPNMQVWALVQQKGGSDKSTICTNLAVLALQER
jgi:Mrp family chromosome partitioning ATPase